VAAREQPAIQTPMMHDEQLFAIGRQDETGASDVSGSEVRTGKRVRGTLEGRINSWLLSAWPSEGSSKKRAVD
jgi:hypothetical protein